MNIDNTLENITYQSESQNIYAYMARVSSNEESPRRDIGKSSQLTNWVLDSGATCHMTPGIYDFILGSWVETDKYIEVADGHFFTEKQTGEVQINMHDNNGKPFIDMLYNVLFAPDLCDQLFSINTLINLVHTCLFQKGLRSLLY